MKNIRYIPFLILLSVIIYSCDDSASLPEMQDYEKNIVKALDLKLISRYEKYPISRLEIFNDTVVGFWYQKIKDEEYKSYFIQSIKNPKQIIEFNNFNLTYSSISNIDYYRNGCLFFGKFGKNTMQSLCTDGTLKEYFKKYENLPFYANKVMIYKDKAVIASMNGVFVFDMITQDLLWEYKYDYNPSEGLNSVVNGKLIITESLKKSKESFTKVVCYDLDKLKINWQRKLENEADWLYDQEYLLHYDLYHDGNNIIIPEKGACYALDIHTGKIQAKTPWKDFFVLFAHDPRYNVEGNKLYVNNFNNHNTLFCIDMKTNKVIWNRKNTYYRGLYKNYVIACTTDEKFFLIINKITGKVENKVARPKNTKIGLEIIDKYILVNNNALYR